MRTLTTGLWTGVLMNALGWVGNAFLLRQEWREAIAAGAGATRTRTGLNEIVSLIPDFVYGLALAWLYAHLRATLGPTLGTAIKAALAVWAIGALTTYLGVANAGLLPVRISVLTSLLALVLFVPAAWLVHRLSERRLVP